MRIRVTDTKSNRYKERQIQTVTDTRSDSINVYVMEKWMGGLEKSLGNIDYAPIENVRDK